MRLRAIEAMPPGVSPTELIPDLFGGRRLMGRVRFMATMRVLVDKYPEGYEGWEKENLERIAIASQKDSGRCDGQATG